MTERIHTTFARPLDGDLVLGLKVSIRDDGRTLAKRRYALEFGAWERAYTAFHPDYPGINIVQLFEASAVGRDATPTLAEAIGNNPWSQRFLVSLARPGLAVVTSRIGYAEEGAVTVLAPSDGESETEVELYDCLGDTADPTVTSLHIGRLSLLGGDHMSELSQQQADEVFRYMVSCAPERY